MQIGTAHLNLGERTLDVRYKELGSGASAVVYLPGLGYTAGYPYDFLDGHRIELGDEHALAMYTPREGYPARPTERGLTIHSLSKLTLDLLRERSIKEATLVAHGRGGAVAVHAAVSSPERIKKLILVEPQLTPEECVWEQNYQGVPRRQLKEYKLKEGARLIGSSDRGERFFGEGILRIWGHILHASTTALAQCVERHDLVSLFGNLEMDRAIVCGADNEPRPYVSQLADAGAVVRQIPGGRYPMVNDEATFRQNIAELIASKR